jgi:hypothetical protein
MDSRCASERSGSFFDRTMSDFPLLIGEKLRRATFYWDGNVFYGFK